MKSEIIHPPYNVMQASSAIFRLLQVSKISGGSRNSQSCDEDFRHMQSPRGFTSLLILYQNSHETHSLSAKEVGSTFEDRFTICTCVVAFTLIILPCRLISSSNFSSALPATELPSKLYNARGKCWLMECSHLSIHWSEVKRGEGRERGGGWWE